MRTDSSPLLQIAPPHAFLMPLPTHGHVTPMLQLAQRLASHGFFVTFVSLERIVSRLLPHSDRNQSATLNHPHPTIQFLSVSVDKEIAVEVLDFRWVITIVEVMKPGVELLIRQQKQSEPPVTCFIADSMVFWAQDVADAVGIPRIAFWPMSASSFSLVYNFQPLLAPYRSKRNTGEADDGEDFITSIPGLAPEILRLVDFPFITGTDMVYENMSRISKAMKSANAAVVHSVYEIESSSVDALRQELPIYTIGPLLPHDSNYSQIKSRPLDEDDNCLQWLNSRDPLSVLYIAFGTSGTWSDAELKELALALEASHEQPFLWVLRPTWGAETSILDIFSEQTKRRSKIVSWAPQLSVLQHPSVGGFLTHGGWNSAIESMYMGVPMIGWPKVSDQRVNMRFISQVWKIGVTLETPKDGTIVRSVTIQKAVRSLFQAEGMEARQRISELKNTIRRAAEAGGSSHKSLEAFMQDIIKGLRG